MMSALGQDCCLAIRIRIIKWLVAGLRCVRASKPISERKGTSATQIDVRKLGVIINASHSEA